MTDPASEASDEELIDEARDRMRLGWQRWLGRHASADRALMVHQLRRSAGGRVEIDVTALGALERRHLDVGSGAFARHEHLAPRDCVGQPLGNLPGGQIGGGVSDQGGEVLGAGG